MVRLTASSERAGRALGKRLNRRWAGPDVPDGAESNKRCRQLDRNCPPGVPVLDRSMVQMVVWDRGDRARSPMGAGTFASHTFSRTLVYRVRISQVLVVTWVVLSLGDRGVGVQSPRWHSRLRIIVVLGPAVAKKSPFERRECRSSLGMPSGVEGWSRRCISLSRPCEMCFLDFLASVIRRDCNAFLMPGR